MQVSAAPPLRAGAAVQRVLDLARTQLGMDVAWVSRLTASEQVFLQVDAEPGRPAPAPGSATPVDVSYCVQVLDGRLPAVVPDARHDPRTRELPGTRELEIGAYVGAPVRAADGSVTGMLCCTSTVARPDLGDRDREVLQLLAALLPELQDRPSVDLSAVRRRVAGVLEGTGRRVVLQPIVDVHTGRAVGAEALSRFDEAPAAPDLWFADADRVGLRTALELSTARDALAHLAHPRGPGFVSVNLSPDTVTSPGLADVLGGVDPARVVVEITEHAAVTDYAALRGALAGLRAAGLRLAVDDAGAGFSSLRHIVQLQPDLIKMDMTLVRGIDEDPVVQALTTALVSFAGSTGAALVAEGVETQGEYDVVTGLGVGLVQGYLLARPGEQPADGCYPLPSPESRRTARSLALVRAG